MKSERGNTLIPVNHAPLGNKKAVYEAEPKWTSNAVSMQQFWLRANKGDCLCPINTAERSIPKARIGNLLNSLNVAMEEKNDDILTKMNTGNLNA